MKFETVGKLDIPEGFEIIQACFIREAWYFLAKHPGEGHVYTLYKVSLDDGKCTPAKIL